jgi:Uncharacterized protein conserved in bacteria (DUF2252)
MDIIRATRQFEQWLGSRISVVNSQLATKHSAMAESRIQFLRGTFYRWSQIFPEVCPELASSAKVTATGDLHIASFGTWRDEFGRLVWGIDDFDEAYPLPYANDLVRLAVSAVIDADDGELKVGIKNVCDFVLDGFRKGIKEGGSAFVIEEKDKWLREIALTRLDNPQTFWKKLDGLPSARSGVPPEALEALERMIPKPLPKYRIVHRIAGTGSLGHRRYCAIFDWKNGQIALEAKEASPSACTWSNSTKGHHLYYQDVLDTAIRCKDPFVCVTGKWLVRRLSPDSSPIEIETLKGIKEEDRLLHAMALEAANIHLGTAGARKRIADDLNKRKPKIWRDAVKDMVKTTLGDWKDWKNAHKARAA